jgi:hypothetical protein
MAIRRKDMDERSKHGASYTSLHYDLRLNASDNLSRAAKVTRKRPEITVSVCHVYIPAR